jgi:magnesium-transporting ATPase (P-type)
MKKNKVGRKKGIPNKILEITQTKNRNEEDNYISNFAKSHQNSVLIIILSATFLLQGVMKFMEYIGKIDNMKIWFILIISALIPLTLSVVTLTLDQAFTPLGMKRKLGLTSLVMFLAGFGIFLIALIYLFFII